MNKIQETLLRRKLQYREFRIKRAKAKNQPDEVKKWTKLAREAKRQLKAASTPPKPAPKPGKKPAAKKPAAKQPVKKPAAKKPTKKPAKKEIKGIDVYEGDGDIDWKKVKEAGYDFAFCKVSEGQDFVDSSWSKARVKAMRDAGVKVGVYHFLRPKAGRTGDVEMKFFLKQAKKNGWGKPGDLRPVIDFEATTLSPNDTYKYLYQAVAECKKQTGKAPIIYTGGPFWNENTNNGATTWYCPLWLAAYVKNPEQYLPAGWKKKGWTIWQHTDQGGVPGVSAKNVDQNVARQLPTL